MPVNEYSTGSIYNNMITMQEGLDAVDEALHTLKDIVNDSLKVNGFKPEVVSVYEYFTKHQIEEFTSTVLINIYNQYRDTSSDVDWPEEYDELIKTIRDRLLDMYDDCKELVDHYREREDIQNRVNINIKEYYDHITSEEEVKKDEEKLAKLKEDADNETDPVIKLRLTKDYNNRVEAKNLSFMFKRLDALNDTEIKSIMDSLFTPNRFDYVMTRYYKNMKRMKRDENVFRSLVDLEQDYLGADYYPFNNLFLFSIIRFIAYADINKFEDRIFIDSILLNTRKLKFNMFKDDEHRNNVINVIKAFDDRFLPYRDEFIKKNDGNPDSEKRKEIQNRRREEALDKILEIAKENGYEGIPEDITEYDDIVAWGRDVQEAGVLKKWLKLFDIPFDDNATLDDLRDIKEKYRRGVIVIGSTNETDEDKIVDTTDDTSDNTDNMVFNVIRSDNDTPNEGVLTEDDNLEKQVISENKPSEDTGVLE